jgi:hypothetical protein
MKLERFYLEGGTFIVDLCKEKKKKKKKKKAEKIVTGSGKLFFSLIILFCLLYFRCRV